MWPASAGSHRAARKAAPGNKKSRPDQVRGGHRENPARDYPAACQDSRTGELLWRLTAAPFPFQALSDTTNANPRPSGAATHLIPASAERPRPAAPLCALHSRRPRPPRTVPP
ncbi:hypothetical protein GCM10010404_84510 [Nonomuraea africana]